MCLPFESETGAGVINAGGSPSTVGIGVGAGTGASVVDSVRYTRMTCIDQTILGSKCEYEQADSCFISSLAKSLRDGPETQSGQNCDFID